MPSRHVVFTTLFADGPPTKQHATEAQRRGQHAAAQQQHSSRGRTGREHTPSLHCDVLRRHTPAKPLPSVFAWPTAAIGTTLAALPIRFAVAPSTKYSPELKAGLGPGLAGLLDWQLPMAKVHPDGLAKAVPPPAAAKL